jgi:hypothetical protein
MYVQVYYLLGSEGVKLKSQEVSFTMATIIIIIIIVLPTSTITTTQSVSLSVSQQPSDELREKNNASVG